MRAMAGLRLASATLAVFAVLAAGGCAIGGSRAEGQEPSPAIAARNA